MHQRKKDITIYIKITFKPTNIKTFYQHTCLLKRRPLFSVYTAYSSCQHVFTVFLLKILWMFNTFYFYSSVDHSAPIYKSINPCETDKCFQELQKNDTNNTLSMIDFQHLFQSIFNYHFNILLSIVIFTVFKFFEQYKLEILEQFKFKHSGRNETTPHQFIQDIQIKRGNATLVGIHIRRGDMVKEGCILFLGKMIMMKQSSMYKIRFKQNAYHSLNWNRKHRMG